jgi:hypothetical protein
VPERLLDGAAMRVEADDGGGSWDPDRDPLAERRISGQPDNRRDGNGTRATGPGEEDQQGSH